MMIMSTWITVLLLLAGLCSHTVDLRPQVVEPLISSKFLDRFSRVKDLQCFNESFFLEVLEKKPDCDWSVVRCISQRWFKEYSIPSQHNDKMKVICGDQIKKAIPEYKNIIAKYSPAYSIDVESDPSFQRFWLMRFFAEKTFLPLPEVESRFILELNYTEEEVKKMYVEAIWLNFAMPSTLLPTVIKPDNASYNLEFNVDNTFPTSGCSLGTVVYLVLKMLCQMSGPDKNGRWTPEEYQYLAACGSVVLNGNPTNTINTVYIDWWIPMCKGTHFAAYCFGQPKLLVFDAAFMTAMFMHFGSFLNKTDDPVQPCGDWPRGYDRTAVGAVQKVTHNSDYFIFVMQCINSTLYTYERLMDIPENTITILTEGLNTNTPYSVYANSDIIYKLQTVLLKELEPYMLTSEGIGCKEDGSLDFKYIRTSDDFCRVTQVFSHGCVIQVLAKDDALDKPNAISENARIQMKSRRISIDSSVSDRVVNIYTGYNPCTRRQCGDNPSFKFEFEEMRLASEGEIPDLFVQLPIPEGQEKNTDFKISSTGGSGLYECDATMFIRTVGLIFTQECDVAFFNDGTLIRFTFSNSAPFSASAQVSKVGSPGKDKNLDVSWKDIGGGTRTIEYVMEPGEGVYQYRASCNHRELLGTASYDLKKYCGLYYGYTYISVNMCVNYSLYNVLLLVSAMLSVFLVFPYLVGFFLASILSLITFPFKRVANRFIKGCPSCGSTKLPFFNHYCDDQCPYCHKIYDSCFTDQDISDLVDSAARGQYYQDRQKLLNKASHFSCCKAINRDYKGKLSFFKKNYRLFVSFWWMWVPAVTVFVKLSCFIAVVVLLSMSLNISLRGVSSEEANSDPDRFPPINFNIGASTVGSVTSHYLINNSINNSGSTDPAREQPSYEALLIMSVVTTVIGTIMTLIGLGFSIYTFVKLSSKKHYINPISIKLYTKYKKGFNLVLQQDSNYSTGYAHPFATGIVFRSSDPEPVYNDPTVQNEEEMEGLASQSIELGELGRSSDDEREEDPLFQTDAFYEVPLNLPKRSTIYKKATRTVSPFNLFLKSLFLLALLLSIGSCYTTTNHSLPFNDQMASSLPPVPTSVGFDLLDQGFKEFPAYPYKPSGERQTVALVHNKKDCTSGTCTYEAVIDATMKLIPYSVSGFNLKPKDSDTEMSLDIVVVQTYRRSVLNFEYYACDSKVVTKTTDSCTGSTSSCLKELDMQYNFEISESGTSSWSCDGPGCLSINDGSTCAKCANEPKLETCGRVYSAGVSDYISTICVNLESKSYCRNFTSVETVSTKSFGFVILSPTPDPLGQLFFIDQTETVYTGPINKKNDHSSRFGTPQWSNTSLLPFCVQDLVYQHHCIFARSRYYTVSSCCKNTFYLKDQLTKVDSSFIQSGIFYTSGVNVGAVNFVVKLSNILISAKDDLKCSIKKLDFLSCSGEYSSGSYSSLVFSVTSDVPCSVMPSCNVSDFNVVSFSEELSIVTPDTSQSFVKFTSRVKTVNGFCSYKDQSVPFSCELKDPSGGSPHNPDDSKTDIEGGKSSCAFLCVVSDFFTNPFGLATLLGAWLGPLIGYAILFIILFLILFFLCGKYGDYREKINPSYGLTPAIIAPTRLVTKDAEDVEAQSYDAGREKETLINRANKIRSLQDQDAEMLSHVVSRN